MDQAPLYAREPYRIFFPAALVAAVIGVLLWPAFYAGWLDYYPIFSHARVMIEGFVGGFAVGFLGTALPKMLSAKPFSRWQIFLLLGLHGVSWITHLTGKTAWGDGLFAAMMLTLVVLLGLRVRARKSLPPPGMALTAIGLLAGTAGAAWSATVGFRGDAMVALWMQKLLYQAFIILPLLGVGSFIFPMILGVKSTNGNLIGKAWRNKAAEGLALSLLILLTYWIECHGQERAMSWLRFALCFIWLAKESGWLRRTTTKGVMPWGLRAGIFCLLAGMAATGIIQQQRIALEHSLYIGGFGLITMMVATRVIYGHSGQGQKFQKWIKPLVVLIGLLLFAMATRISADFLPRVRISHHVYAAILWVIVCIIWGIAVLPSVRKTPFPRSTAPAKPKGKRDLMKMDFRK